MYMFDALILSLHSVRVNSTDFSLSVKTTTKKDEAKENVSVINSRACTDLRRKNSMSHFLIRAIGYLIIREIKRQNHDC